MLQTDLAICNEEIFNKKQQIPDRKTEILSQLKGYNYILN